MLAQPRSRRTKTKRNELSKFCLRGEDITAMSYCFLITLYYAVLKLEFKGFEPINKVKKLIYLYL